MPVRNACVARGRAPGTGATTIYTVPVGNVFLCKFVGIAPINNVDYDVGLYAQATDTVAQILLFNETLTAGEFFNWSGWTVINAADHLVLTAAFTDVYYWVSGAVLPYATP